MGMWALFHASFREHLTKEFGLSAAEAKTITARAKPAYKRLIAAGV